MGCLAGRVDEFLLILHIYKNKNQKINKYFHIEIKTCTTTKTIHKKHILSTTHAHLLKDTITLDIV
jgi:hypothetical protein